MSYSHTLDYIHNEESEDGFALEFISSLPKDEECNLDNWVFYNEETARAVFDYCKGKPVHLYTERRANVVGDQEDVLVMEVY